MTRLKKYNSFRIDAFARDCIQVHSIDDIPFGKKTNQLILGKGSNVLLPEHFDGTVLINKILGRQVIQESENHIIVKFGSGEVWHDVVQWAVNHNYGGIENLSLIPGTIGAAPIQNIGAYGVELKDVFYALEGYTMDRGSYRLMQTVDCAFGYRDSIFKSALKNNFFITSVSLRLTKNRHRFVLNYGKIAEMFDSVTRPKIASISKAVISIRESKLPNPDVLPNAGSFFKNPVVSADLARQIAQQYPDLHYYPLKDTEQVKIPAAWLIEKCGWKGKRIGDAGVYAKHALILVNYGKATGKQLFELAQRIIEDVQTNFGIKLQPEVRIIGKNSINL